MSRRWGDHRDWPDVPERQLRMVRVDATRQLRTVALGWHRRMALHHDWPAELEEELRQWAADTVDVATTPSEAIGVLKARQLAVEWSTIPGEPWPPERWWWSPLGLAVTAWSDDGWWTQRSGGAVRQYVSAGEVARHVPVSARSVRRWGENRKRVRQQGTQTDAAKRMLHRTDLARLLVMRWSLIFR